MLPTIKHAFAVVGLCLTAVTGATTASTNVTVKPWDLWPRPTNCTDVSNLLSVIGYGTGDEVPFIGMICTRALPLKAVGPSSDYYKERGPDYGQFVYARIPTSEGFVPATDCLLDLGYDACKTQCDATGDIIGEYSCFTQNTPPRTCTCVAPDANFLPDPARFCERAFNSSLQGGATVKANACFPPQYTVENGLSLNGYHVADQPSTIVPFDGFSAASATSAASGAMPDTTVVAVASCMAATVMGVALVMM